MAKMKDSQLIMLEHSKAKVDLYKRYLSIYLNVISRVSFISKVYLYDLFAGEGKYLNGEIGSSIASLECIKSHYFSNNNTCPNINIWFNDSGKSEIDTELLKIERIKKIASTIFTPTNVSITYTSIEYLEVVDEVIAQLQKLSQSERALLFIDPWGYKEINPQHLKEILCNGKTEVLLFLPISFMYRFADKALIDENFAGGRPLEKFLSKLFENRMPDSSNQMKFIDEVKNQFREYLKVNYADTFTIERGNKNFFCLFFFTNNKTGFYKMLDSKWDLDEEGGRGFRVSNLSQQSMFDEISSVDYVSMVEEYLKQNTSVTNQEMFDFGLYNGFLPKHTKKVLDYFKSQNRLQCTSLDNKDVRGYYIDDNHIRKIRIKLN